MAETSQRTLSGPIIMEGIGIHSGIWARTTLTPAPKNSGVAFIVGDTRIPALAECVSDTRRCTRLSYGSSSINTVEHLMASLYALSVDNVTIFVEGGSELPILDGSAAGWTQAILETGITRQSAQRRWLIPDEKIVIREGESEIEIIPARSLTVQAEVNFDFWKEGEASAKIETLDTVETDFFCNEIAPARTFAFQAEVEALVAAGLALGGSLDNALIITPPDGFSSPLRMPHEWAVHKLLDLIGDMALTGGRIAATITATRPGHRINNLAARALCERATIE